MSDSIAYRTTTVPEEKSPTEYTYTERRAEILSLIEEAGHPDQLNQTSRAERYGTSQSNISKDFKRLREHVRQRLGRHRHTITETVYRKAVREYVDRGEYKKAVDVLESWNDWLREEGVRDTEPDPLSLELAFMEDLRRANEA
jgi:hypothetical protein